MFEEIKEIILSMNWYKFGECNFQLALVLVFVFLCIITIFFLVRDRDYYQDKYEKLKIKQKGGKVIKQLKHKDG
uniref:Uncharacterized protein n=1 Tax=viral metagenome TaxID=1070528 RepID=A0A6H1ZIX1_9ZZZZ